MIKKTDYTNELLKITFYIFIILIILGNFSGCSERKEKDVISQSANGSSVETTYFNANINKENETSEAASSKNGIIENGEVVTIKDIENWNHPTKSVFKEWDYTVTIVQLLKDKTYPIFYVQKDTEAAADESFYKYSFLKEVAEKNGYWDFKIVNDLGDFVSVECDKNQKRVVKSVSNKGVIDYTKYSFSDFEGEWYSTDDINFGTPPYILKLHFNSDGKTAGVYLSGGREINKVRRDYTTTFDYSGNGKLKELPDKNNEITVSKELDEINFDVDGTFIPMGSEFLRKSDIYNIIKCMDIVAKNEGIMDWRKANNFVGQDSDKLYIRYEGRDSLDLKYQIGVRWCKNTVIKCWYFFDPKTYKYEIEGDY